MTNLLVSWLFWWLLEGVGNLPQTALGGGKDQRVGVEVLPSRAVAKLLAV